MHRYVYIALIAILTLMVLAFGLQNLQSTTVSLLPFSIMLPLLLLILTIYFLCILRGGLALSPPRSFVRNPT